MVEIKAELNGEADFHMEKVFTTAYKNAFTKSVEYMFSLVFEYAPIGKSSRGAVNLRNALAWDFDWTNMEAFIGVPKGSEVEKIAFYTEFGTGERGLKGWQQFFEESKPKFTVPIVPLKAKAMHYVDDRGNDIYMKKSKGQPPQSWARKAFTDAKPKVKIIWETEFSDKNIQGLLKKQKIES